MMGKATKIFMVFAIIATIVFGAWGTVRVVKSVQFSTNCKQYLKRAADANTVETAKEELAKAISYAEENNLTEGVVSVFLHQPKKISVLFSLSAKPHPENFAPKTRLRALWMPARIFRPHPMLLIISSLH